MGLFTSLSETSGKFSCWFSANPDMKKEMLATSLTAMANNRKVVTYLTTTDEYGVVMRLYMQA